MLDGLTLKVLTQDRFLSLWRGIEYQLKKVGVTLDIEVVKSEAEIFGPLLKTNARENKKAWDLLVWGNDDWYFNHPWTAFFVYRTNSVWSTISDDPILDGYLDEMFQASVEEPTFVRICEQIMQAPMTRLICCTFPHRTRCSRSTRKLSSSPIRWPVCPCGKFRSRTNTGPCAGPYPEKLKELFRILRLNSN